MTDLNALQTKTPNNRADSATRAGTRPRGLQDLPPELQLLISKRLIYPDALSLKHTCRAFYNLVDTGVELKIDWLIERHELHLECPNDRRCDLGSDLKFCRGSVRLLMQRRRWHMECETRPGLGCLVYGTQICTQSRQFKERWRRWLRARLTLEVWWVLLAVLVAAVACLGVVLWPTTSSTTVAASATSPTNTAWAELPALLLRH